MTAHPSDDILVIGAGIIGLSAALELQKQGRRVRILDRTGVAAEASAASAGAFAFTDIVPLATPGIMRKAPKWLLDPLGPLSVPPAYALQIAPWMLRFWRASWRSRYQAALQAQVLLMAHSRAALERQIADVDGEPLMQREGQLQLYEGESAFRAALPDWQLRRTHGIRFDLLRSPEAIAEVQPGLASRFTHAAFTPDWMNTVNPKTWAEHLAQAFVARGGCIGTAEVTAMRSEGGKIVAQTKDGPVSASQIVVACGAWSHHLARTLGENIPLETERGYNTTLPPGAFGLKTHLTFPAHGFVVTKISGGVRVGGAVELGGLKLPPNYRRADILLQKAKHFLSDLDTAGGTQWMGFRPSMPDSLPVISRSSSTPGVIYAFGHGHLGLTQAAGTAELVASLAANTPAALPMQPYSAARF